MSIPASTLVSVVPGVLGAGGNPLDFNGVILSDNSLLSNGAPTSFANYAAVAAFFGASSIEAKMASIYFTGFNNATQIPSALLFARYPNPAIAAFMIGGIHTTLSALQAITAGAMAVTIDGAANTITALDLHAVASLAAMATAITAALTPNAGGAVVSYDTTLQKFIITSGTTGVGSTLTVATGNLADALGFTVATGAALSQGADVSDPTTFMNTLLNYTQDWVAFTTTFEPIEADKEAFATWTDGTKGRFMYAAWDTDGTAVQNPLSFTGFGKWLKTNQRSGTAALWNSTDAAVAPLLAAFVLGATAATNFNVANGRISYAFKGNSGLTPEVTDATSAANLLDNGYSFYGQYATANQQFLFFNNGQISGQYLWIDAYVGAIWLNNALQLALMELFANTNSLPYNTQGYSMIAAAAQGPITQALNNGVIRPGVALSAAQIAEANSQAGTDISVPLQNNGYYFQVVPVTDPIVRAARTSPACNLWYTDGGSIQKINLASIDIQ